ncbi:TonB-dependent receptor plug domain-containing protein [Coralloluteibacterium stylophorae]|uniref:TonB-dependent receptor n=1 Tax=Coralloluteibacterium stylophorae TaxID=1776034 RepID=A0AAP2CA11_9GAMM|nr:TonB-dependent receptor [Coralloluteibacterium stylophorae]MBS7455767.1 TonB-dependent receptor [Coralloluteibacterium stylophorae]
MTAAAASLLGVPAYAADDPPARLDAVEVSVTTATRTERLLSDVPVRTEVLRAQDIELRAALDFSKAADLINGLRVESNCQNCNTSEAQLLGLPGAYNQLLFDGTPLLSTLGSVYGLEQIPAAFINTVEVVKGGGSSLYGPGAVAGVINLVPQQPRENGGFVRYGIESQKDVAQHNLDGRADLVSGDGRFGLAVVGQASSNDAIDFNGDGYSEIAEKEQQVLGFQSWYSPTDTGTLRVNYQFTHEDRRGGNRLDQPEWLANIAEAIETRYHRGGLRWDQIVSDDFDFSLGYAFAYIERDSFYGGLGEVVTDPDEAGYDPSQLDPAVPGSAAATAFDQYGYTENPLHYVDSQFNWRRGAHALAFGLQYRHEAVEDENRDATGITLRVATDDSFSNLGLYVQDEWTVSEAVDLVLGLRGDRSSTLDDPVVSPRVALAFQANPNLKLRAGISTGFRAPEVFSEDLHVDTLGAEPIRIRNADDLSEERAVTGMLSLDWRSDPADPRWMWDATVSLTELRDAFVLGEVQTGADGSLYQVRSNASGSQVAGVETNLGWQASPTLRLTAGAAWYRSRFDAPQVIYDEGGDGGVVIATRDYLKTPRWSGVAQATWSPNADWDAYLGLKYTGTMLALNNNTGTLNRTPEFWVTDLGATRHFHDDDGAGLDLSMGVRNLFDERQEDLERGAGRDSDYVYGPRFARSFYASLRYSF